MFLNGFQTNKNFIIIKKSLHFSNLLAMKKGLSMLIQVEILSISFSRRVGVPKLLPMLLQHHLKFHKGGSEQHMHMERKLKSMMDFKKKMLVQQNQNDH